MDIALEPDLLRTFVAIADTGSFTRAADTVHRTQSAVSMQIKRLEVGLGKPLFLRNGRTVELTSDGMALLGYARRILALQEEAVARIVTPELTGHVRIGTPDDYINRFLPGVLKNFAQHFPLVEVQVHCEPSANLRRLLNEGRLDLALVSTGYEEPVDREVWREAMVWATSPMHVIHEADPLPLALSHGDCVFRWAAERALQEMGRNYRIAYTSPSFYGQMAAVNAGLAVTLISRSTVTPDLLVLSEDDGFPPMPEMGIHLCFGPGQRNRLVQCLADHIVDSFKSEQQRTVAA